MTHDFVDLAGDAVDLLVIARHALDHDLGGDADHVTVAAAQLVGKELEHRLPERELARQALTDVVGHGGAKGQDVLGQVARKFAGGPADHVLHHHRLELGAAVRRLFFDGLRDVLPGPGLDHYDAVAFVDVEAGPYRVARAGRELRQHPLQFLPHEAGFAGTPVCAILEIHRFGVNIALGAQGVSGYSSVRSCSRYPLEDPRR